MGSSQTKKDFPDTKQRVAVCNARWRKAKKSKATQIEFSSGELQVIDALIKLIGAGQYGGDTKKKKKKKKGIKKP